MTCDHCPFVLPCWQHTLDLRYCTCGALHVRFTQRYATVRCGVLHEALAQQSRRFANWTQHPLDLQGQAVMLVDPFATVHRCSRCYPEYITQMDVDHYLDDAPTQPIDHAEYVSRYRRRINHEEIL